jgi:hypothetical protein
MKTSKLQGYFDVRRYAKNVEHSQRVLCSGNGTITFNTTFSPNELPSELKEFAREYTNKNNEPRVAVQFKVSRNCKWYDGNTYKPMSKPLDEAHTYSVLEGKKYEVVIDYTALHGDVTKLEAHGFWANAILLKECDTNPFAEEAAAAGVPLQADAPATDIPAEAPATDAVEAVKQATITNDNGDDELPF